LKHAAFVLRNVLKAVFFSTPAFPETQFSNSVRPLALGTLRLRNEIASRANLSRATAPVERPRGRIGAWTADADSDYDGFVPNGLLEEHLYHVSQLAVALRAADAARDAARKNLRDSCRVAHEQGASVIQLAKAADLPAADIEEMLAS
jgi:hypothetical protein